MDDINRLLTEIHALNDALPPVEAWHPERTITIDIRIDRNGQWFHEGSEIKRFELARLFSSVLRKDPDGYCLVTPAERCLITVDDVPFVVHLESVETASGQPVIFLRTQMGDLFQLDKDHPLQMRESSAGWVPYVLVRGRLEGRIDRASYYQLMECLEEQEGRQGVVSAGCFFPLA